MTQKLTGEQGQIERRVAAIEQLLARILSGQTAVIPSTSVAAGAPSAHFHVEGDIIDGALLARIAANETITGEWIFNAQIEGVEIADPAAPAVNRGRLYFRDNGAGKTQLVVRFNTGAVQVIATEP